MGLPIRDERQMKALTGLSQAQFDALLPVFSDIYQATQQRTYEEGVQSGTRRRHPGGGSKGKLPTMGEKSVTSGKAGGLKKVEPLKAVRCCEPLKAVRLCAAYRRPSLPQIHVVQA